jgi:hypothetical protein
MSRLLQSCVAEARLDPKKAGLPRRRINSNARSSAPRQTAGPTTGFSSFINREAMRRLRLRLRLNWQRRVGDRQLLQMRNAWHGGNRTVRTSVI